MTNRRKFLIGMGSLAAGSAAAIGTGAFSTVAADRTVSMTVAGDSSAYLALSSDSSNENGEFAEVNQKNARIDLDTTSEGGTGINKDATTVILDILSIQNQGTQDVVTFVPPRSLGDEGAFNMTDDGIYFDPQFSGMPHATTSDNPAIGETPDGTIYASATGIGGSVLSESDGGPSTFESELFEADSDLPFASDVYLLEPGESMDLGVYVKTNDQAATNEINYNMVIKASEYLADKSRNQGNTEF